MQRTRTRGGENGEQFRLRRDVHVMLHDGLGRVMDFRQGRFFTLDAIAAEMLSLSLEGNPDDLVSQLALRYGADPEQVRGDWSRLAAELRRDGLVEVVARPLKAGALPGRLRLFLLLALAWLSLRLLGWAGTIRTWRRGAKPASRRLTDAASRQLVEAVGRAVQHAAAGHVLNTECKERSLVAWHVLRQQFALPAEIVVGAIPYPFQAHAWVECGSWTITDERANCDAYVTVARFS